MFKAGYGTCKECGGDNKFIVVKAGWCGKCNFLKKQQKKGKTVKSFSEIRSSLKQKPKKATGELELFLEIWNERPHTCQVTGLLIRRFDIRCFSHCLAKGAYPSLRLDKENIWLVMPEIHHEWEFGDRSQPKFESKREKMQQLKEKYYEKK